MLKMNGILSLGLNEKDKISLLAIQNEAPDMMFYGVIFSLQEAPKVN